MDRLTGDGDVGLEESADLVRHIFVKDASTLNKVLGHGDKTVHIAAWVDASILIGFDRRLIHQLLVGDAWRERLKASETDAHNRYVSRHLLPPCEWPMAKLPGTGHWQKPNPR